MPVTPRLEHGWHSLSCRVHQPGLRLPQRGIEPTPWLYQETSVCTDGDDLKADLIHMRHEHDVFRAAPKGHPQIALGVHMRLHPRREQGANVLAHRPLSTAHARARDEAAEYLRRVLVSCLTGEKWGRSWQRRGRHRRSWSAPDGDHECLNKTRNISQVNKLHWRLGVAGSPR